MTDNKGTCPPPEENPPGPPPEGGAPRAAYEPPRLEHLGSWQALTLQQSIPIFP